MAKYSVIKMGDREGNGAIVKKSGLFFSSTWTANNDDERFERWVCRETGEVKYKGPYCYLDFFYKAQFDTI
ncbi:hypothetical protein ACLMVZ_002918 [Klebsiella aerogenes]